MAVSEVEVISTVGVLEGGEASSVSLFELSAPVCPDPFCVFAWICGGGATGVGGGIFPGDAGDVGCLEPWDV